MIIYVGIYSVRKYHNMNFDNTNAIFILFFCIYLKNIEIYKHKGIKLKKNNNNIYNVVTGNIISDEVNNF